MDTIEDIFKLRPNQTKFIAEKFGKVALNKKFLSGLKEEVFSAIEIVIQKELDTHHMVINLLKIKKVVPYVDVNFMFWLQDLIGFVELTKIKNQRVWKANSLQEPKYMFSDVLRMKAKISDDLDKGDIVIVTEVNGITKNYKIHNTINDKTTMYNSTIIDVFSELSTKI